MHTLSCSTLLALIVAQKRTLRNYYLVVAMQEREDPSLSDWDRFARAEYVRLAMEEEGEFRGSDNQNELWVQQIDSYTPS